MREEEVEWEAEDSKVEAETAELDPAPVREGRSVDMNCRIRTQNMFEFESREEAMAREGTAPITTMSVERNKKDDDGREDAGCVCAT